MATDYEQIKKDNIRRYGEDTWYQDLLSNMYSDKTHFIFELIQNAEDVGASEVEFYVFKDRIELVHNGKKLFDENDVIGICGLAKGTKNEDFTKIGKFGLGFKSVYAYTNTPLIYSRDESFKIEMFVRPSKIEPLANLDKKLTKFVLPFKREIDKIKAFDDITNKLNNLDLKTILFLKNVTTIKWTAENGKFGKYIKEIESNTTPKVVKTSSHSSDKEIISETWLMFDKPLDINKLTVDVALKIDKEGSEKQFSIIPTNNTELSVFFPTKQETHLKFLIQGPYRTTHNRESIPFQDEWNQKLLKKTSILIQDILLWLKKEELLDSNTLQLFPIDKEIYSENNPFYPIFLAVKEKILSGDEILPTNEGDYVSSQNALLARTKELRELLKSEQISFLFKKNDARWLDSNITIDKMPLLRKYLMEEIGLQEITPEKFASVFTKEFIKNQNDEWVIEFYNFLSKQPALWREKKRWESEGVLRNKPFIRLESNNDHACPFDNNDNPQVFLASGSSYDSMFPIIKKGIAKSPQVKEFLKTLGIKEPNKVAGIRQHILPKYDKDKIQVDKEENLRDVEYIKKTINSEKSVEIDELIKDLKSITFLTATNPTTNKSVWNSPSNTYLGKRYTKSDDLDIYFENNEEVFFLDDSYSSLLTLDDLKKLGCNNRIVVKCRTPSEWNHHITLRDWHGSHERGLDGFDPDCEIEGLAFALKNINLDKTRIIWTYLMRYAKSISGVVEYASRQDFSYSTKQDKISKMGKLIIENSWLPDKNGDFHRPDELFLSEVHDTFDKESIESINIAKKIMKKEIEQKILETCSESEKEKMERLLALSKRFSIDQIESAFVKLTDKKSGKEKESSYKKALGDNTSPETAAKDEAEDDVTYPPITSDRRSSEEKKQQDGEDIDAAKDDLEEKEKDIKLRKERGSYEIDPNVKNKLIQEYDGRCQVCFKKLVDNDKKLHLKFKRLVQPHQSDLGISDESNVLALCPNHWIELSKNYPWCFINDGQVSDEPDFADTVEVNKFDKDLTGIKIKIRGKDLLIYYDASHLRKFKHLYENN